MPRAKDTRDSRRWPKSAPVTDHHAPAAIARPDGTLPAGYYHEPDPIETGCPACTLEWRDGAFTHERSCVLRLASR